MPRLQRRWMALIGTALTLVACLLVGVAAELVLRGLTKRGGTKTHIADPVRHHRLRAAVRTTVRGVPFETNTLGLRDREVEPGKAPGVVRVLMLGDSFTEGGGLALDATVPKVLEARLAERECARRIEVVNGGVASYSPILAYLLLRDVGLALAPDLVVLNFDMTDVHDDVVRTAIAELDARGLPVKVPDDRRRETAVILPPVPKPRWLRGLDSVERAANQLAVWQAVRFSGVGRQVFGPVKLMPERMEELGIVGDVRYDPMTITRDDAAAAAAPWGPTVRYLLGIRDLARSRGAAFALVVYPHPHQTSATASVDGRRRFGLRPGLYASERAFRILEELGQRGGFPVINVVPHFRRHAADSPLFWDDDIHHTPLGARILAEGIREGLVARGLVPC